MAAITLAYVELFQLRMFRPPLAQVEVPLKIKKPGSGVDRLLIKELGASMLRGHVLVLVPSKL